MNPGLFNDYFSRFFYFEIFFRKYTPRPQLPAWAQPDRKNSKKGRPSSKIDFMETVIDDTSERTMAIARLRDREYAHLNELINSSSIEQIVEPLSAITSDDIDQSTKARQLGDIIHSIDSLRCSDTVDRRARRQVDMEKNRAKLGILIF